MLEGVICFPLLHLITQGSIKQAKLQLCIPSQNINT